MAVTNINQTSEQFVESLAFPARFQIILHKSVGGQKLCGETQVCIHNMVGGGQFIRGGGGGGLEDHNLSKAERRFATGVWTLQHGWGYGDPTQKVS